MISSDIYTTMVSIYCLQLLAQTVIDLFSDSKADLLVAHIKHSVVGTNEHISKYPQPNGRVQCTETQQTTCFSLSSQLWTELITV